MSKSLSPLYLPAPSMGITCRDDDGKIILETKSIGASPVFMTIELSFIFFFTYFLLKKLVSLKSKSIFYYTTVFLGWLLATSTLVFIPVDISMSYYRSCVCDQARIAPELDPVGVCKHLLPLNYIDLDILYVLFTVFYWVIFFGTWILYPFLMSYATCAEFTFWLKVKTAIRDNLIFYLGAIVLGVVLFIFLYFTTPKTKSSNLIDVSMTLANSWGLFLIVCLMGVGFIQVPRACWNLSNANRRLSYHLFMIGNLYEKYRKSHEKLRDNLCRIRIAQNSIKPTSRLYKYFLILCDKCDAEYYDIETTERGPPITYSYLTKLYRGLINSSHEYVTNRALFHRNMEQAFMLQDVIESEVHGEKYYIPWTLRKSGYTCDSLPGVNWTVRFIEWLYWRYLISWIWRSIACIFIVLSIVNIWSEMTMFMFFLPGNNAPMLSIYYLFLWKVFKPVSTSVLQLVATLVLAYNALCIYHAMTKIKIFKWYRLLPYQQTDIYSLFFSASYACRISVPMAINLIYLTGFGDQSAAFMRVMGGMNQITLFGIDFNIVFPCLILFVAGLTLFDVWNKICYLVTCGRWDVFEHDDILEQDYVVKGRELLQKEREQEATGVGVSYFGKHFVRAGRLGVGAEWKAGHSTIARSDAQNFLQTDMTDNEELSEDLIEYIVGSKFDEYTDAMMRD